MSQPYRGVFTIPSTPFREDLSVDWEGLRRIVDFCVECGAHGIVWPVNASEFYVLSDAERMKGAEIVVKQAAGRVPVVIGAQGVSASHAAMFGRHANAVGADAVIAMAPYVERLEGEEAILDYYQAISDAVDIPIFCQNHARGTTLAVKTLARLVREVEHMAYIKEEVAPVTKMLTRTLEAAGPKLQGIFGGAGGRYLLLEHPRGTAGQMPGCHVTDVVVQFWDALETGDREAAKRIYGLLAPLYALETECKGLIYKEVLRRRGVIMSAMRRNASPGGMDAHDHRALDEILADLAPLLTWHGGSSRF